MYNKEDVVSLDNFFKHFSWHFVGKNSEIKMAEMVQAVVIFFSIPRSEWPGMGPLFESDSNKQRGPRCGHYSSYPLGHC